MLGSTSRGKSEPPGARHRTRCLPAPARRAVAVPLLVAALAGGVHAGAELPPAGTELTAEATAELLRLRLEAPGGLTVGGEPLVAREALVAFYERRLYRPAWLERGRPGRRAASLATAIRQAARDGLDAADYHAPRLAELAAEAARAEVPPGVVVDFELLASEAFFLLGAHLANGRVHPQTFDAEWLAVRREVDLVSLLEQAVADDAVVAALAGLRPDAPAYDRLVATLARYRELAADGGWEPVEEGATLEPGAVGPRVAALARRLRATADLAGDRGRGAPGSGSGAGGEASGETYDDALAEAVRRFQVRHGLEPDAKVGPRTLEALNVPAAARARQIELNLVRWRWLPQDPGHRHVLVNIPGFELRVVEEGATALAMRVIVGRPYRRTPVFSDRIRYLVFNPYWEIPPSIAVQDKLPLIRRDPGYLAAQGIRVYAGWGADERAVDPATVDWGRLGRGAFPYRLRQDPGPLNALGRVKLMFPNEFNVYLHDTPARELFRAEARDFSSGCIRVERALDLAAHLLAADPAWSRQRIDRVVASGDTVTVALPEAVPVHLQYWTAWVEADGSVHFRRDVYERDARLDRAIAEGP